MGQVDGGIVPGREKRVPRTFPKRSNLKRKNPESGAKLGDGERD